MFEKKLFFDKTFQFSFQIRYYFEKVIWCSKQRVNLEGIKSIHRSFVFDVYVACRHNLLRHVYRSEINMIGTGFIRRKSAYTTIQYFSQRKLSLLLLSLLLSAFFIYFFLKLQYFCLVPMPCLSLLINFLLPQTGSNGSYILSILLQNNSLSVSLIKELRR